MANFAPLTRRNFLYTAEALYESIGGELWPQPAIAHESLLISPISCDRQSAT